MQLHANAALSLNQRRRMVLRVLEEGWSLTQAAEAAEVSERTCRKWVRRFAAAGPAGLLDRSSAPKTVANRTCGRRVEAIAALRRVRFTGPQIAELLAMAESTVSGCEIEKTYTEVSTEPGKDFIFPTGRAWAEALGYPRAELARVPDATVESFAGVANPFSLGRIDEGAAVLDLGCGAGTDLLIPAQMVGPAGSVVGVDMTGSMLKRAGQARGRWAW